MRMVVTQAATLDPPERRRCQKSPRSGGNIGEGASHTRQFQCGLIEVRLQDFVGRFLGGH